MRINFLLFLTIPTVLLLPSCKEIRLNREVKAFYSTRIELPKMEQMVMGTDSVVVDLDTIPVLAVIYKDAKSCVPCLLEHMSEYQDLIDCRDKVGTGFYPVFLFSPSRNRLQTVRYTLCRTRFRFPFFIDKNNDFPKLNKAIPKDRNLHVFLLDKSRRVVLVGDPRHNPRLMGLYRETIDSLVAKGGSF